MIKDFKIKADQIFPLIEPMGGCFATDNITVKGMLIGYMYRDIPDRYIDSGWRFFQNGDSGIY